MDDIDRFDDDRFCRRPGWFDNGLLTIVLIREVPEAMKPRRITIVRAGNENQKTENTQAA